MDETKKTETMNSEESEKVVKTRKKIKVRLQNPIIVEKTAVPITTEEPAEEGTVTEQKPRAMERVKDVLKGVGLGVVTVFAVGSAYIWATSKPDPVIPEPTDGEDPEDDDEEEETEDSEESDGSCEAPSEE